MDYVFVDFGLSRPLMVTELVSLHIWLVLVATSLLAGLALRA